MKRVEVKVYKKSGRGKSAKWVEFPLSLDWDGDCLRYVGGERIRIRGRRQTPHGAAYLLEADFLLPFTEFERATFPDRGEEFEESESESESGAGKESESGPGRAEVVSVVDSVARQPQQLSFEACGWGGEVVR